MILIHVFRRGMKPCCELFYHFYTKQGQIIYQTNTMFKYKNDKIPIFLDLLCTDTVGCYHMIEKYTKIMLQIMHYQFYAVFSRYWWLVLSHLCHKPSRWLDITILCSLKNYLSWLKQLFSVPWSGLNNKARHKKTKVHFDLELKC